MRIWLHRLIPVALLGLIFAAITERAVLTQQSMRLFGTLSGAPIAIGADSSGNLKVTLASGSTLTGPITIFRNGIGTTSADGVLLRNTTAAAAGAQQYSPRQCWEGQGWKTNATAATMSVVICAEVRPVQGAAAPTGHVMFSVSINGAAFVDIAAISSDTSTVTVSGGMLNVSNLLVQGTQLNISASTSLRSNANGSTLTFPADGEVAILANGAARNAGLRASLIVEANTATKTPTALENNEVYTNTGDADGSAVTLLDDPTVGTQYQVIVTVAQTITITKNTGETLKFGSSTCGTSLTSATIGSAVTIVAATGGSGAVWVVTASTGTWTCNA